MPSWYQVMIAIGLGAAVAYGAAPWMGQLARYLNLVDTPTHRKVHKTPVPYLGGLVIWLGAMLSLVVMCQLDSRVLLSQPDFHRLLLVLGAGVAATVLGVVDDKIQVKAWSKFACQLLIATVFVALGYRFDLLTFPGQTPIYLGMLSAPLTIFWILAMINGLNLVDGVDGLAGSLATAMSIAIAVLAMILQDSLMVWIGFGLAGGCLGFTARGWAPASIFMGDAGSIGIGMLVATSLVCVGQRGPVETPSLSGQGCEAFPFQLLGASCVCLYPLLEVALAVTRRVLWGKAITTADRAHIHHRMLQRGWTPQAISICAAVVSVMGGSVAVLLSLRHPNLARMDLAVIAFFLVLGLHFCGYFRNLTAMRSVRSHFIIANKFASMQTEKLTLTNSVAEVLALLNQACTEFGVSEYTLRLQSPSGGSEVEHTWQPSGWQDGFADSASLPGNKASAHWTFGPRAAEEDLDIEYRLLMNEFMRNVLRRIQELSRSANGLVGTESPSADHMLLTSRVLRERSASQRAVLSHSQRTPA